MELTKFEQKVLQALESSACNHVDYVRDEVDYTEFIEKLRKIMPPICGSEQRKFLDILEQESSHYSGKFNRISLRGFNIPSSAFPEINLSKVINVNNVG